MRDNPLWGFQLRNTKSTTPAQAVGGKFGDAHAVDQHAVLEAVRLTEPQKCKILGAQCCLLVHVMTLGALRNGSNTASQPWSAAHRLFLVVRCN